MSEMNSCSVADMAALMNNNGGNNGWMNNPFMYLIWLAFFGNNGFGFNRGAVGAGETAYADLSARIGQLGQQISDNQNTNNLAGAIGANGEQLHSINNGMNLGFAGTNASINTASLNSLMGQKDLQSAIQTCCCNNQTAILNQTNQLQSRIDQLANGMAQGFAQVGFLTQQQTNELNTNATANTQRILDKMCADTTQGLRDKLWEMSQSAQTASIVSQLKTT